MKLRKVWIAFFALILTLSWLESAQAVLKGSGIAPGTDFSGGTITATTKFLAPDGTCSSAPSYAFTNETNSGLCRSSAGNIGFSVAGGTTLAFAAEGFRAGSGTAFCWSSNATATGAACDTFVVRDGAANTIAIKSGANAQTFRIYGTTTGPKYLSLSHDGTNGVIDTAASSGLVSIAPTNATSVTVGKKITAYNAITTAGQGVPVIVAVGRSVAQTAAVASVSTFTNGAADASFQVSSNVLVTTATTHSFSVTVSYTDEGNTARVLTLPFTNLAGTFSTLIVNTGGAIPYESPVFHIRVKASTAITIGTTGTFTTVTYNVEGVIKQVN